jgi:Fuc2NAc and GlcNAc transferase
LFVAFAIASGTAASWLFLLVLIPQLRRRLLDEPNARSSHRQPTPRGGGLAFVAVASASSGMALLSGSGFPAAALPLLAAPLAVVGLLDDRHNLPASCRYGVQLLTAALMLGFSPLVQRFGLAVGSGSWLLLPVLALLVIAVTAVINFTNFMDGLDGLVAGCMAVIIAALSLALTAPWPLWALVGSLLGFLLWNWSPAKVFMGDVGSTFIGAVFAGLVLQAPTWPEAFGYLLVATPLLGDAGLCVPRRLLAGQRVFQAHRLHLFQRLHQAGWPHARVTLTYIAATAVLAVAMLAGGWPWVFGLAVVELLVGVWLDQRVAVPFAVASQS